MASPTLYGYAIYKGGVSASQDLDLTALLDQFGTPVGPALAGQYVRVDVFIAGNADRNPSAVGYANLLDAYYNDTDDTMHWSGWKFMGGTPDTVITVTAGVTSTNRILIMATVWDNVDPTTPHDGVTPVSVGGINGGILDPGSITPGSVGSVLVFSGCNATHGQTPPVTLSTGYLDWEVNDAANNGTSYAISGLVGYLVDPGGAYDGAAWTTSAVVSNAFSRSTLVVSLRGAAAAGSSGTAALAVPLSGSAAGAVDVAAAAVLALPLSGTATGAVDITGNALLALPLSASATGTVANAAVNGAASLALPLAGVAAGGVVVAGAAALALPITGAASGTVTISGGADASLPLSGTATGAVGITGGAALVLPLSGTTTGDVGDLAITGVASLALPLAGTGAGSVAVAGAAALALPITGAASGATRIAAGAVLPLPLAGLTAGTIDIAGLAALSLPLAGAASGAVRVTGSADIIITLTGIAAGVVAAAADIVGTQAANSPFAIAFRDQAVTLAIPGGGTTIRILGGHA